MKRTWICITIVLCIGSWLLVSKFIHSPEQRELQRQQRALQAIAEPLKDAILAEDVETIIRILAPPDKYWPNFELSIDNKISVTEFAQELRNRSGQSYAVLFDTAQWQQIWGAAVATTVYGDDHTITAEDLRCLRDYLLEAGDRIEVRTEVKPGDWSIPPFGRIIFDWPGREKTIFGHPNADPGFFYIDGRWDITTYFGYRG